MINQRSGVMAGNNFFSIPTNIGNIISLYTDNTVGANNYTSYKDFLTGSYFEVPAGKILMILGFSSNSMDAAAGAAGLGYGDTGVNGATAPTNFRGSKTSYQTGGYGVAHNAYDTVMKVPAGKYPCFYNGYGAGISSQAWGVLVDE